MIYIYVSVHSETNGVRAFIDAIKEKMSNRLTKEKKKEKTYETVTGVLDIVKAPFPSQSPTSYFETLFRFHFITTRKKKKRNRK